MSRRLAARVRLRQMRETDEHQSSAWQHLGLALVLLAIGLGGPIVDLWLGDDPQPVEVGDDPPVEALTWIPDAPSPWLDEPADRPSRTKLDVWKLIPPPCKQTDRTCID